MNPKEALKGMLAEEFEKVNGHKPAGDEARQIEKLATEAAQRSAVNQSRPYRGK